MEIKNYNNKEYLENLLNDRNKLKEEIIFSKGLVLSKMKLFKIDIQKEFLTDDNFTFFGIPFLAEILEKEGLKEKEVLAFFKKQASKTSTDNSKSLESFLKNNKEEILNIIIMDSDKWISNMKKVETLGVKKEFEDWLLSNKKNNTFDIDGEDFLTKFREYIESFENNRKSLASSDIELFTTYLDNFLDSINSYHGDERLEKLNKLSEDLNNLTNYHLKEEVGDFTRKLVVKLGFEYVPYQLIKNIRWSDYLVNKKMNEERIDYLKGLFKNIISDESYDYYGFNLDILHTANLNWDIPEDKELLIKILGNFSKNVEEDKFYNSKLVLDGNINLKELIDIYPKYLDYFVNLDDSERWSDNVISKLLDLPSRKHGGKIDLLNFVKFFTKTSSYRDGDYIELDKDFLNKIFNKMEEQKIEFSYYNSSSYLTENTRKMLVKIMTVYLEDKINKIEKKSETINVSNEVLEVVELFNTLVNDERSDDSIKSDTKNILKFEETAFQYLEKLVPKLNTGEHINLITGLRQRDSEFLAVFSAALIKNIKNIDSLYLVLSLLKDRNRKSYSSGDIKELLSEDITIKDLLVGIDKTLKELPIDEYNNLQKNIANQVENKDYRYVYRSSLIDTQNYIQIYYKVAFMKLLDRSNYPELTDVEFGNHLNSLEPFISKNVEKGHEIEESYKSLKKEYKSKDTTDNILKPSVIIENFNEIFLNNLLEFVTIKDIEKVMTKKSLPSVIDIEKILKDVEKAESGDYGNTKYKNICLKIIEKDIDKYKSLKPILLRLKDTKNITDKMSDENNSLLNLLKLFKNKEVNDYVKIFVESDDPEVYNSDLFAEINQQELLTKENIEKIFLQNNVEKINILLDKGNQKELVQVISELDFDLQFNVLTNKDIDFKIKDSYSSKDRIKFNCQKLEDIKKITEYLRPHYRKNVVEYIKEESKSSELSWEAVSLLENVNIKSSKEIIYYLIDEFPLSFFTSYKLTYKGTGNLIDRSLTVDEYNRLLKSIEKKVDNIFAIHNDPNADLNMFRVKEDRNRDKEFESCEEFFERFTSNLTENKDKPLYYLLFLLENKSELDRMGYYFIEKKDNNYDFTEIPNKYVILNEFQQSIKEKYSLNAIKGFGDDELVHNFVLNYVDLDILLKGVIEYKELYKNSNKLSHRLEERLNISIGYLFHYIEKNEGSYNTKDRICKIDFSEDQKDLIFQQLMKADPSLLFNMHTFIFREFITKNDVYRNRNYEDEELSVEIFKDYEKFLITNYDYDGFIEDFLLNGKDYMRDEKTLRSLDYGENTIRFLNDYVDNSEKITNDTRENIVAIIHNYENYILWGKKLESVFKKNEKLGEQYNNVIKTMDFQKDDYISGINKDLKVMSENLSNQLDKQLIIDNLKSNPVPVKAKKVKF